MDMEIEEGKELRLNFEKLAQVVACGRNLVPVVVQEVESGEVLLVAYANQAALDNTLRTKRATFWSTSRNELWVKGATSGDVLAVVEIRVNCEQNSLLYRVTLRGIGACHTRDETGAARRSCYYRRLVDGSLEHV